jgi:2-keto-4-pentenoate hydratase/2-oxohepta-3-ene-1,7-dioic acid hydratase in catechol pathway
MRLTSFEVSGRASYGIVIGDGVVDVGRRLGKKHPDLKSLLANGAIDEAAAFAAEPPDHRLDAIRFLPVIPNPGKIVCAGLNYHEHRIEVGRDNTEQPTLFLRVADSQQGHDQPLMRPRESEQFDYEAEIAVIIGKAGRRIGESDAWSHVAGYACYNDGSVRDWQRHTTQWIPGKNFSRTGGFGPWMVTADEIAPGTVMTLTCRLNGQVMQQADTSMMIFSIPRLIAYASMFTTLEPGDVIVTGTPGGVGARRKPPVWMKAGDVCEVEVDRIGVLRNPVAND